MKRAIAVIVCLCLLTMTLFGCRAGEENNPGSSLPESTIPHEAAITWTAAFRDKSLPEGYVTPDTVAYYSLKDGVPHITAVPISDILSEINDMPSLPRTHYYESFLEKDMSDFFAFMDYAFAHDYCRFVFPSTTLTGSDISRAGKYVDATFNANYSQSVMSTAVETEWNGEPLYYNLVALVSREKPDGGKYRETMEEARRIVATIPASYGEAEKAMYLYSYLTSTVVYDHQYYDNGTEDIDWGYDALIKHRTVCAGYAEALYYLFNLAGIECIKLQGDMKSGDEMIGHMWNAAKINGIFYLFDATWDAGVSPDEYLFFGVSRENMEKYGARNLVAFYESIMPTCIGTLSPNLRAVYK